MSQPTRSELLNRALDERILVLDGAMGTALHASGQEGCLEHLSLTHPERLRKIHEDYLAAGCDIVETNSFGGSQLGLEKFKLGSATFEINLAAAQLAVAAAKKFSTPQRLRFVAGSMGPPSPSFSTGQAISFSQLVESFWVQARGLFEGGVDYFLLETCQDARTTKAGVLALEKLFSEKGERRPIALSATFEPNGTLLSGQSIEAWLTSVSHWDLLYLGLNCATGPEFMTDLVRSLASQSKFRLACVPNAGLPDEKGCYLETPEMASRVLSRFIHSGWINLLGGCCGMHTPHIQSLVQLAAGKKPRIPRASSRSFLSGMDRLEITSGQPLIVGNPMSENSETPENIRTQIKNGAHVALLRVDALTSLDDFLDSSLQKTRAPWWIESQDPQKLERVLQETHGKSLISGSDLKSMTLLSEKYGADVAIVFKIEKSSSPELLKNAKIQHPKSHFSIQFGAPEFLDVFGFTLESIPPEARRALCSVFLQPWIEAGADLIRTDARYFAKLSLLDPKAKKLVEDYLNTRDSNPVSFLELWNAQWTGSPSAPKAVSPSAQLSACVVEGSKEGLTLALDQLLVSMKPIEIITGPLMAGMDQVHQLFRQNKLILAQVLQSSEVMKFAVSYLDKIQGKASTPQRGKVVLATVKGDVHEIGKNLVGIILANNGFDVVDLGTQVLSQDLVKAVQEHQPDLVGLSGLLVKSAQQMVNTAEALSQAGISTPMLVGGAALSSKFVDQHIAKAYPQGTVAYAQDFMSGLDMAKIMTDPALREKFNTELQARRSAPASLESRPSTKQIEKVQTRSALIPILPELPQPPNFDRHVIRNTPIEQIWNFINPLMLYGRHLGIRGSSVRLLEQGVHNPQIQKELQEKDPKALEIWRTVQEVKEEYRGTEVLTPTAVYQFLKAGSRENQIVTQCNIATTFEFPRQQKLNGLCIADYVQPLDGDPADSIGVFVVTVGKGIRQLSELLKNRGHYLKSHILQALALESAEAYAEWTHSLIRKSWGFPDPPEMTLMDRFQSKYQGKRYSFGYPACPKLDDQTLLWKILRPEEIGIQLTDGFMMEPEASISALVFHHPAATYFSVGYSLDNDSEGRYEDNRQ